MTKQHVNSLEAQTDVSGWQCFSIQNQVYGLKYGQGKYWFDDGKIFVGEYQNGCRQEGLMYELQADQTHTIFQVSYDELEEEIERKEIS